MTEGLYELPAEGVMRPDAYVEFLVDRVADAVVEAWNSRQPGSVGWGWGHAVLGHNRRAIYEDGHAQMYTRTHLSNFRGIEGPGDHGVEVLFFWNNQQQLIATALYHLLENALLYSLGQVELSVDRVPGRLEIAVRDEGPGLAIDQQEQIFQKFVRAAEDQDRIPGSGIGLAIVDMIARQLKGEILLESGQGFFSTFTLRLPVSQT